MVAVLQTSDIDLWSDEVLLDPYPVFTELREQAAAVRLEKNDVWVLTRYQEIREALGNWEAFLVDCGGFQPGHERRPNRHQPRHGSAAARGPAERPHREPLPRALRKLKASIDQKADDLVAGVVERGSFDAISDLARELPLQVVLDLIGVQGDVRDKILDWGAAAFNVLGPMNERTAQNFPLAGELFHWATTLQREELVEGSMGRAIFDAGHRGEIPAANCGKIVHQYVAAGLDTTIAAIGNAIAAFGANPDQYDLLRQDASLIPAAFNETLRYEALMHAQGRGTTKDVDVDGTIIPAGSQVALLFCAGNRDPRHYQDPDTFRGGPEPDRPPVLRVWSTRVCRTGPRPAGGLRGARRAPPPGEGVYGRRGSAEDQQLQPRPGQPAHP